MELSDKSFVCVLCGRNLLDPLEDLEYDFSRKVCKNCVRHRKISSIPFPQEGARAGPRKKQARRSPNAYQYVPYVWKFSYWYVVVVSVIIFGGSLFFYATSFTPSSPSEIPGKIAGLKKHFPSQVKESWKRILSALEVNGDTTKSLLLLHGDDKFTCDCLKRKLASIHRERRKGLVNEHLTFEGSPETGDDYGLVLEHYRPLIKEHGVLMVDLNNVSGNIARIFHPLCDETYPDGNPALLIFTLRDLKEHNSGRTPLNRAETILKVAWRDLPENEINPLISRIVKNVVLVLSEKEKPAICTGV